MSFRYLLAPVRNFILLLSVAIGACSTYAVGVEPPKYFLGVVLEGARNDWTDIYFESLILDEQNNQVLRNDTLIIEPADCGEAAWYCVTDTFFQFAFPITGEEQESWVYKNYRYITMRPPEGYIGDVIFIVGEKIPATDVGEQPSPIVYMYNREAGLVGIQMVMSGKDDKRIPVTFVRWW